jgi:hypothetical protein
MRDLAEEMLDVLLGLEFDSIPFHIAHAETL